MFFMLAFLLAAPLCGALLLKRRVETFIFPVFAADIVIIYFFAIFNALPLGVYAAVFLKVILAALTIFMAAKKNIPLAENLKKYFLTPGLLFFGVGIILAFWLPHGRIFVRWDEFSWWGKAAKITLIDNALPVIGGNIKSIFLNYPPGSQIFYYLMFKISGMPWNETFCYQCWNILIFSILTLFFKTTGWKNYCKNIFLGCAAVLVPQYFYPSIYSWLYVDGLLGLVFGACLLLTLDEKIDWYDSAALLFSCAFMVLIKNSGVPLVIFALAINVFDVFRSIIGKCLHKSRELKATELIKRLLPLSVFVVSWSWGRCFNHYKTAAVAYPANGGINPEKIIDALQYNHPSHAETAMENFFKNFFCGEQLCFGNVKFSFFAFSVILGTYMFLILCLHKKSAERTRLRVIVSLQMFFFCLYSFFLMLLYILIFSSSEAVSQLSLWRYISTYLLCLSMLAIELTNRCPRKKISFVYTLPLLVAPSALKFYSTPVSHYRTAGGVWEQVMGNIGKNDRLLVIDLGDDGGRRFRFEYLFPEKKPVFISSLKVFSPNKEREAETFGKLLESVDYCYVLRFDKDFMDRFGGFFTSPEDVVPCRLLRVADGKLEPYFVKRYDWDFRCHTCLICISGSRSHAEYIPISRKHRILLLPDSRVVLRLDPRLNNGQPVRKIGLKISDPHGSPELKISGEGVVKNFSAAELKNGHVEHTFDKGVDINNIRIDCLNRSGEKSGLAIVNVSLEFEPRILPPALKAEKKHAPNKCK